MPLMLAPILAAGAKAGAAGLMSGAAAAATRGIFGSGEKRQIRQQQKLQDMQVKGSKELSEFQKQQELEMWEKTNYAAQREQLEKAGLSVSMMYGGGGGGGATTTGGGAVALPSSATADSPSSQMMAQNAQQQTALQTASLAADIKVKEAQAKNLEADASLKGADEGLRKEQTTQSIWENEALRNRVGLDRYVKNLETKMESETQSGIKNIRETEAWIKEAFDISTGEFIMDKWGIVPDDMKGMLRKSIRAGLEEKVENITRLRNEIELQNKDKVLKSDQHELNVADQVLKKDQHELNELEKEIKDLKKIMANMGMNEQTIPFLSGLLKMLFMGK